MNDAPLIPLFDVRLSEEEVGAVADTLRSGWLTMGPRTQEFEAAFAEHLGVKHAVALSSCTAALHLAYLAAGIGPGDEVIVPAITFVASAAAVRYCGGTPVLAEVRGTHDLGIDPDDVARRIGERTRAVCAVHYGGYRADTERLREVCEHRGVALVEDSAHHPILRPTGLAGCFSFFSNKVLSCGEGGLLATDDDDVAELARSLRSHAMTSGTWDRHRGHSAGYDVVGLGYNYRMDEPRAALLSARLPGLADDIAARRRRVHHYRELLREVPGVSVPYEEHEVDSSSCYVMPVTVNRPELRDPQRSFMLEERRVQTSILYPAINEFSAYAGSAELPRSELVARSELTLPLFPQLGEADQERVVTAVADGLRRLERSPSTVGS
ncbi:MAG: DegT/DnrJ/EryC1/StrS family aminotransferase [Thermoleophilaceae bacterium]